MALKIRGRRLLTLTRKPGFSTDLRTVELVFTDRDAYLRVDTERRDTAELAEAVAEIRARVAALAPGALPPLPPSRDITDDVPRIFLVRLEEDRGLDWPYEPPDDATDQQRASYAVARAFAALCENVLRPKIER